MPRISDAQIAGYAKSVGLSGDALVTAVAVALAESSGDTSILGPVTPWGRAVGLWQIMPLKGRPSTEELKNPSVNAQQMYKISEGGKVWARDWEAYSNGRYRLYLARARKAAGNPDTSGHTSDDGTVFQASNPLSWPGEIVDLFKFLSNPITWERAGMLIAGGLLLVFALAGMAAGSGGIQKVAGIATDLIPQTRAIKAAAKVA